MVTSFCSAEGCRVRLALHDTDSFIKFPNFVFLLYLCYGYSVIRLPCYPVIRLPVYPVTRLSVYPVPGFSTMPGLTYDEINESVKLDIRFRSTATNNRCVLRHGRFNRRSFFRWAHVDLAFGCE